jgi:hypothetical protein
LQGTQDIFTLTLISALGPLALPDTVDDAILEAPSRRLIGYVSPFPSDWIIPPDLPPPRR